MLRAPDRSRTALALACALASACAPEPPARTVVSYRIGGRDHLVLNERRGALDGVALQDQAARDLDCAPDRIHVLPHEAEASVVAVEGCGAQRVYLRVRVVAVTRRAPAFEGSLVWVVVERFVPISGGDPHRVLDELRVMPYPTEPLPPPIYLPRAWSYEVPTLPGTYDHALFVDAVDRWIGLNQQGAIDLACPRGEVMVGFRPSGPRGQTTPIAEGCGHRATYLPGARPHTFDLISIVALPPPSP